MTVVLKASGIFPRFSLFFFFKSKSTVQKEENVANHCSSHSEHQKAKANEMINKSKTVHSTQEMQSSDGWRKEKLQLAEKRGKGVPKSSCIWIHH